MPLRRVLRDVGMHSRTCACMSPCVCMHVCICVCMIMHAYVPFGYVWFCKVMYVCRSTYEGKCKEEEGPVILRHEHSFVTLLSSWKMTVENLAPLQTWPLLL